MRFYIINFHYPDSYSDTISTPPLGVGYVLEALEQSKIPARYWEVSLYPNIDDLIADIKAFSPTLIGCSFYSHHYKNTYSIINKLYGLDIPIVCGGVHVNAVGAKVMEETKTTFLIQGEGEESLLLLLQHIGNSDEYAKIPGLVYWKDKEICQNPKALLDLATVNYPKYGQFDLDAYADEGRLILSSRGCPYHCTFCIQSALLGKKWRKRPPESIMSELEYWASQGITNFNFADDNLTLDKERIIELCKMIQKSRYTFHLVTSGVRINNVDMELLKIMKDSGFYYLSFGIESGNDRVLKEIRKRITVDEVHKTLDMTCKLGFDVKLYFIINNRTETYKEAHDSFRLARMYPIVLARFTNLVPYPGTYDYKWILNHGRLLHQPGEYLNKLDEYADKPFYDGPGMSLEERYQLIKDARVELKRYSTSTTLSKKMLKGITMIKNGELVCLFKAVKRRILVP